jgi:hypothetical protein
MFFRKEKFDEVVILGPYEDKDKLAIEIEKLAQEFIIIDMQYGMTQFHALYSFSALVLYRRK